MCNAGKPQQRRLAYELRNAQKNKAELSQVICDKFIAQEAYHQVDADIEYLLTHMRERT